MCKYLLFSISSYIQCYSMTGNTCLVGVLCVYFYNKKLLLVGLSFRLTDAASKVTTTEVYPWTPPSPGLSRSSTATETSIPATRRKTTATKSGRLVTAPSGKLLGPKAIQDACRFLKLPSSIEDDCHLVVFLTGSRFFLLVLLVIFPLGSVSLVIRMFSTV